MTALPSNSHEHALPGGKSGSIAPRNGMRDLLRDTALLVTSLATGGQIHDADGLRRECRRLMERFSDALEHRGYPEELRTEAMIAQCGLLDETALRTLPTALRAGWEHKPLQVERFNLHDAGESVVERLEARMREAPPQVDLLECYATILSLGFVGRYAREGEAKRAALVLSLNDRLEKLRSSTERPFVAERAGRRLSDWFYRLSPWGVAGLAGAAAVVTWVGWSTVLELQLAHLVPAKGIQP